MEELPYRIRLAEPSDEPRLRQAIGVTLTHPEGTTKRTSYRAAAQRHELLLLEQFDRREREWKVAGMVDYHVRVDDTLTIKDVGTAGATLHSAVTKQLISEVLRSAAPREATIKTRADAQAWNELIRSMPGFELEGQEYRRPHYYYIWRWTPGRAAQQARRAPRGRRRRL